MNQVAPFTRQLVCWFAREGRSFPWRTKSASKYQKVVSEVLLQRTRAETVSSTYQHFFSTFPSWKSIVIAPINKIEEKLKPIGLWKRRAASLKSLAIEMVKRNGRFPKSRKEIENLPGVGQYIANAVLMFCHGEAEPLLDTNMARVLERYFGPRELADIRYDPYLQDLSKKVVKGKNPHVTNWAILDFAALVCKIRSPLCGACQLASKCHSNKTRGVKY